MSPVRESPLEDLLPLRDGERLDVDLLRDELEGGLPHVLVDVPVEGGFMIIFL